MINKEELSTKAVETLESNGWFEARHIEVIPYPEDFKFPNHVRSILESLYGLNVETEPRELIEDNIEPCFYGDLEFFLKMLPAKIKTEPLSIFQPYYSGVYILWER